MRREEADILEVHPEHELIHKKLINWACWARPSIRHDCQPIFRNYKPDGGYYTPGTGPVVNGPEAVAVQQLMKEIPLPHRLSVGYWYVTPYKSLHAQLRKLAVDKPKFASLVHEARTLLQSMWR